jgi:hypothetical protein
MVRWPTKTGSPNRLPVESIAYQIKEVTTRIEKHAQKISSIIK